MGHASLEVTAIYANALGEEQYNIAARMWGWEGKSLKGRKFGFFAQIVVAHRLINHQDICFQQ
jgi:hypothetical protein